MRLQGWLVRPGATYGADYVLYRDHPSAAHSSFCVLGLMAPRQAPEALSWGDVEAANRVATQVRSPQRLPSRAIQGLCRAYMSVPGIPKW